MFIWPQKSTIWDVTDLQNEFATNSSFCGLNDLVGLNSIRGHVDLNGLISSEYCNTKLFDTKMTYTAPFVWHISQKTLNFRYFLNHFYWRLLRLFYEFKIHFNAKFRGAHTYEDMGNRPRHVLGPYILKIKWCGQRNSRLLNCIVYMSSPCFDSCGHP